MHFVRLLPVVILCVTACGQVPTSTSLPHSTALQPQMSFTDISASSLEFDITDVPDSTSSLNDYFPDVIVDATILELEATHDLLHEQGEEVVWKNILALDSPSRDEPLPWFPPAINGYTHRYTVGKDIYYIGPTGKADEQLYSIFKADKEIFSAPMCYGSDFPVEDVRIVEGLPAFTFYQGPCVERTDPMSLGMTDIAYDGKSVRKVWGVDGAHFLFSYQGKLGFVAQYGGQEYVFFNGKIISHSFDVITTHYNYRYPQPVFQVYDNGALLFLGIRGQRAFVVEVDLNLAL